MRVGIDVTGLFWRYRTGVQNYYWGLLAGLTSLAQRVDFSVALIDRSPTSPHRQLNPSPTLYEFRQRVPFGYLKYCDPIPRVRGVWRLFQWWNRVLEGTRRHVAGDPTYLWTGCDVAYLWTWDIGTVDVPSVILIPDLLPQKHRSLFDKQFASASDKALQYAVNRASAVVAITEHVKNQLVLEVGVPAEKIFVAYPGIDPRYRITPGANRVRDVLARCGVIPGRFILSVGFLDPRKNISRLVKAFSLAKQHHGLDDVKLVLAGPTNQTTHRVMREIEQSLARADIVFAGYVPDDELPALYHGAAVFVYCSQDEGFGIPNVEAMACGCSVITSNLDPFPEVCGDAVIYADPGSEADIADKIIYAFTQPGEMGRYRADGIRQASRYTFEACAEAHLEAFSFAARQRVGGAP